MLRITETEFMLAAPVQVIKKPVVVQAVQITEDFVVPTLEGNMIGKPGDYVIRGVKGELYPIDMHIFIATYEKIT